jgi:HAD superfamily hydrolase (TIGR01490 family)
MIGASRERSRVAAFFDIDGTLLPKPPLERRFFAALRRAHAIPSKNYITWLAHGVRLAPQGLETILHANKMYLRDVVVRGSADACGFANVSQIESSVRAMRATLSTFFPAAIDQAAWHASIGHAIVLVSGTLAPLAHHVAVTLSMRLIARGAFARVGVCATHLEEIAGRWTGRILGDAMFGIAKARAVQRIAAAEGLDLRRCYAYGDTSADRWMLNTVGRPAAVNPSPDLERTARLNDWPVLRWKLTVLRNEGMGNRGTSQYASVASPGTETDG